jgi:predicted methyltransferase
MDLTVLSHYQVRPLLQARNAGQVEVEVSTDLNLTTVPAMLDAAGVHLLDGWCLSWDMLETIVDSENACFLIESDAVREIRAFSETTNWVRSLYPTASAPTMLVSGLTMHRIVGTDPYTDTLNKIAAARPVVGEVLDTATGLGYTAIEAAKTAQRVITVELDPTSIEIARQNPWSQALFDNPSIEQVIGHAWDVAEDAADETFSCIIHDPPAFSLAGDLYAGDFYAELYRILKRGGRLFHYIGDPDSRTVQRTQRGVMRRLQEAGFSRVVNKARAFGVTAYK